jgi:hypothetical protein
MLFLMTYANDAPRSDGGLSSLGSLEELREGGGGGVRVVLALGKPGTDLLSLLLSVGREELAGAVIALEKVWDEDTVLGRLARGQNIGALDRLVGKAEDVVDDNDTFGGIRRASDVYRRGGVSVDEDTSLTVMAGRLYGQCGWTVGRKESTRDLHVFRPPRVSYAPLAPYPEETTGGMLQQASLWPC